MNMCDVISTLATYFMTEIENKIAVNNNELIVELANNKRIKITAKV